MSVVEVIRYVLASFVTRTTDMLVIAPSPHPASVFDRNINVTYAPQETTTPLRGLNPFQSGHAVYPIIIASSYWLSRDGWMVRYGIPWCHAVAARLVYPNGRFYLALAPVDPMWDRNDDQRFATVGLVRTGPPIRFSRGSCVVCLHRKWDFTFQVVPVRGDGNCQFRAISRALFDTEERHGDVRAAVVRDMRDHPLSCEWRCALAAAGESTKEPWEQYCDRMGTNGEWGDQTTLVAASRVYNVAFVIRNASSNTQFLQQDEKFSTLNAHTRLVYLEYTPNEHYNLRCLELTQKRCRSEDGEQTHPSKRAPGC